MQRTVTVPYTIINVDHGHTYIYKRFEELGRGGFATVYRVIEQSSGKEYALKVIPKERITKPKAIEKMKSEIAIQASLNHPNVLRSYAAFEDQTNHYIVTELCPGHSVRDLVRKAGHLSEHETAKIMKDVLEGPAHAVAHGFVVRPEFFGRDAEKRRCVHEIFPFAREKLRLLIVHILKRMFNIAQEYVVRLKRLGRGSRDGAARRKRIEHIECAAAAQ